MIVIRSEKQEIISRLKEQFQDSSSAICVDFRGINVEKITQFRRELQQASVNYQVVKNTLARRAIKDSPFQDLDQFLVGPTGIIFCAHEASEPAKILKKFADETNGALQIKGGYVDGTIFDAKGIEKVASLPPRQELLAQLVSTLQSPVSGLVGTLQGIMRDCVYTLQALAEKRASEEQQ
ncbi:50S ribosomal protein L10 [candidate division KSB3 bacterium]|uniref:Large ribosomal subunit protein uL10 n=1 Tax=candidate division KSB3 bacterium TaxID=2044937 RepID=A0A9D5Q852_9BACT|nr:50S ribosomal protein L10 [candidate division KSB3 bacterium]MBD3326982.1 50S ribosomal protein L10 [candidate division KSB3 bacterium]